MSNEGVFNKSHRVSTGNSAQNLTGVSTGNSAQNLTGVSTGNSV
ncbi:hypothetical protein [Providencia sp. PROV040]|nr:hypothetical protein [Providencia sp. PROV040]WOB87156.1 hypothetical protein P3L40_04430 [Providencia sp. PROV040]